VSDRLLHSRQYVGLRREPEPVFLCDKLLPDPDGELASGSFDELGVEAGRLFNQRCRTGSARKVVSNLAVANLDALHDVECQWTR
jgi:hypothetical protein